MINQIGLKAAAKAKMFEKNSTLRRRQGRGEVDVAGFTCPITLPVLGENAACENGNVMT